jgi:hypothetical protein
MTKTLALIDVRNLNVGDYVVVKGKLLTVRHIEPEYNGYEIYFNHVFTNQASCEFFNKEDKVTIEV